MTQILESAPIHRSLPPVDLELSEGLASLPLLCHTAQHLGYMSGYVMDVIQLSQWRRELAKRICKAHTQEQNRRLKDRRPLLPRAETAVWFLTVNSVLALSLGHLSVYTSWSSGPRAPGSVPTWLVFSRMLFGVTHPIPAEPRGGGEEKLSFLSKACLSLASQHSCTLTLRVSSSLS